MIIEQKLIRATQNRCEEAGPHGQCPYEAIPGSKWCQRHASGGTFQLLQKQELRTYDLGKFQARVDKFKNDPKIKGLREEIGILRMILEEILKRCEDTHDILVASSKIAQIINQIKETVISASKLESALGETIDKIQAMQLAEAIITIIVKYIDDKDVLDMIANDIGNLVEQAGIV